MVVSLSMTMLCVTPAGTQTARCGGTTQTPSSVETRIGACGRIDQLRPLVVVRQDLEAADEILGHGRDGARDVLIVLWIGGALAVSRHRLAF